MRRRQVRAEGEMTRFRSGSAYLATAASTVVRLVILMKAVIATVGDPNPTRGFPPVSTNRCSDFDLSGLNKAMTCGPPLSYPCFDFSRCRDGPTVYVYDHECSLADSIELMQVPGLGTYFRQAAKEAGVLADTYHSACFFINVDGGTEPQCATTSPLWNEGRNHVMFDLGWQSREHRTSFFTSYAMEAATSQHSCYYRSGYDISIGHTPKVVFHELQSVSPDQRRYFLTFRGTRHRAYHGSEERASIQSLHNDAEGVVVALKCHDNTESFHPELTKTCAELLPRYNAYDYGLLMNSTFGLVPGGKSPGSFRLGEVLSAGCIPVIVARDFIKPFTEEVDWSEFSFTFAPDEVPDMLRTLRSYAPEELKRMQEKALNAYWKIYGWKNSKTTGYYMIAQHVIDTLVKRIRHREA